MRVAEVAAERESEGRLAGPDRAARSGRVSWPLSEEGEVEGGGGDAPADADGEGALVPVATAEVGHVALGELACAHRGAERARD